MKTITIREDINLVNIRDFFSQMVEALNEESEIVLDFSGVTQVDRTVRQVLITCFRRARREDIVILTRNMSEPVRMQLRKYDF